MSIPAFVRAAVCPVACAAALLGHAAQAAPTTAYFNNADGLQITGYVFEPAPAPGAAARSAVVMLHGCAGVFHNGAMSSIYVEWAQRLNQAGHVVLLVDSFTPRSAPNQCGNGGGVGVSEIFDRPKDAVAAAQYLKTSNLNIDPARIGLLGWSHGGSTVVSTLATTDPVQYNSATSLTKPFKVGVAFYPGGKLADYKCGSYTNDQGVVGPKGCWYSWANSKWDSYAPLNVYHGKADQDTPYGDIGKRIDLAQKSVGGASVQHILYDGAKHSFDDPNTGGGACVSVASTPDACAKTNADPAALAFLWQYLQ